MASPKIKQIKVGDKTRYRFVVDIGQDPKTGKRKQLTRTYDGLRKAESALAEILTEVAKDTYVQPAKGLTVNAYLDEWLHNATRGREANTFEAYANGLKPARDCFGELPLQKLSTKHVEDMVDWMSTSARKRGGKVGTGLSPRSVQITLSKLNAALNKAVQRHLVQYNVAAPVDCPPQNAPEREPWSPAEVKKFLAYLVGKRLHAPVLLSLMGIGPAELCGERWEEDVDLDAETIKVAENTRTLSAGRVLQKGGKTKARKRTLPLPPQVTAALRAFKALQAKERLAAGEGYERSGYVLVDELGRPFTTVKFRRTLYKLMAEAGVRKVRPYDARHACLSYMATHGVPDVVVSAWAGHADLTTAKRVYIHPTTEDLEQGRDVLAQLLG